ncbi:MAG: DoxX family protein [Maribacter sp.]
MFLSFGQEYLWYTKALLFFSGISFLFFGISCLWTEFMVMEFKRYGLEHFRVLVGCLQLLGAFGLFMGLYYKNWAIIGSLGLCLLMTCGFLVRIKIKDSFLLSFPSLFYAMLNAALFILLMRSKTN